MRCTSINNGCSVERWTLSLLALPLADSVGRFLTSPKKNGHRNCRKTPGNPVRLADLAHLADFWTQGGFWLVVDETGPAFFAWRWRRVTLYASKIGQMGQTDQNKLDFTGKSAPDVGRFSIHRSKNGH
jgi:hypothetical protein